MKNDTLFDDFLSIPNSVLEAYKNLRYPLFIKRFFINRDIKQCKKFLLRLRTDHIILDKDLLDKYILIIMNDIQPDQKYKSIVDIKISTIKSPMYPSYDITTALVDLDIFKATIKTNFKDRLFEVNIYVKESDDTNVTYTFVGDKLKARSDVEYEKYISIINARLIDDIIDYFDEYFDTSVKESSVYKGDKHE